jgi:UDP-glucose 4-epimerase
MKKKYLVTGGTGFIGSNLVKKLVYLGHKVKVFDNNSRGSLNRLKNVIKDIEVVHGDIRDQDFFIKSSKKIDTIIHLAAINGTKNFYLNPEVVLDVGVKGLLTVIEGAKRNSISEIFFSSSSEVYQSPEHIPTLEDVPLIIPDVFNPRYSYGGSKIISELILIHGAKNIFKKIIIFRPHNVYGPDMGKEHVIPELIMKASRIFKENKIKQKFVIQGNGKETRSFIHISDFISGLLLVMNKGRNLNIYNIGTMEEISIKDLSKIILKNFNLKNKIKSSNILLGSALRRCPDISKIRELGFKQKILLKEGLKDTINWYGSI